MIEPAASHSDASSHAPTPPPEGVVSVLLASIEALAQTGQIDAACRLAGRACVALRSIDPRGEQRFNALLHRLAPRLSREALIHKPE